MDQDALKCMSFWALDKWGYENNVKLHFIDPGKPNQNAFIESFNASFRDECLNVHWFLSLEEARRIFVDWKYEYNYVRPHGSLDMMTPMEFINQDSEVAQKEKIQS